MTLDISFPPASSVSDIAHIIQLSVAPVFLLAGIGSILNVMASRLGRVVDRARGIERDLEAADAGSDLQRLRRAQAELRTLDRRIQLAHGALSLCGGSAVFICLLVGLLFLADLMKFGIGRPVAVLFVLAMALVTAGLMLFLGEIYVAMRSVRVRTELLRADHHLAAVAPQE